MFPGTFLINCGLNKAISRKRKSFVGNPMCSFGDMDREDEEAAGAGLLQS